MRVHGGARRIYLLMFNACGSGGVARTVINLANRLAEHHEVELISLFRRGRRPRFPVDPRVRLSFLVDDRALRKERGSYKSFLAGRSSWLRPTVIDSQMSLLTDVALLRKLRGLPPGMLVSTRPSLHLAATRLAPRRLVLIGWDHLNFPSRFRTERQAEVLRTAIPRLDAYAVLTNADAEDYRRELPDMDTHIQVIRNAASWPISATPAALENKVVVAAGRLSGVKGFDRMIRAYRPVASAYPDWRLHIYGHGEQRAALARLITDLGLGEQVHLMGFTQDFRSVLENASFYAMSSRAEGFPMVLLEAMSTGLPLVSFDCPRGPGEIIDDGKNGRLVPNGDGPGFTAALLELIGDAELRKRFGAQALEDSRQYEMDRVVAHWETLFERAAGGRRG